MERLRSAFPEEVARRLEGLISSAEREGVPRSLLVDKALEGVAKGAPPEQVLETVSTLAEELRTARVLVGPSASAEAVGAAAEALRAGVDRGAIRALADEGGADLAVMLLVAGELVQEGVRPEEARSVLEAAVEQGMQGDGLLSLPRALRRRVRDGAAPPEAASSLMQALRQGRPPGPF